MAYSRLKVYYGPQDDVISTQVAEHSAAKTVSVSLAEVLPLLAEAQQSQRTWLRDFADDSVTISADLYEVLLAYQHYRRPSA